VDIVLIMDMSLSVQGETWGQKCANFPDDPDQCAFRAEKDFAKSLLAPFYIDSTYTRVAVAFFHRGAVLSLGLNADPTQVRRDETKRRSLCVQCVHCVHCVLCAVFCVLLTKMSLSSSPSSPSSPYSPSSLSLYTDRLRD
jgi:hypothetical protein